MKILFLITQSEFGGAQRYVYHIASHLAPQGDEVVVAVGQGDQGLNEKLKTKNEKQQLKVKNLKFLKRSPDPVNALLSIKEIYNLLKKEKPNVLFLNSTTAGILGSIAGFLYRMFHVSGFKFQVVYRIGGWAFRDPRAFWQKKMLILSEKFFSRFKDKIIVNSKIDKELAIKYKIAPKEKLVKIYNGIDINKLKFLSKEQAREALKLPMKDYIVGTIANFYKTKGLKYLIEAIYLLQYKTFMVGQARTKIKCVVIGAGPQQKKLKQLIKKSQLQKQVILAGRKEQAYKYLPAFDVFVLPSLKEGFPWVVLEAMAAQLPIIATQVGAVPEIIINDSQGWLIKPKDSQELAEKLTQILSEPEKARAMGILAKKTVEKKFTLEKMIEQTKKVIKN